MTTTYRKRRLTDYERIQTKLSRPRLRGKLTVIDDYLTSLGQTDRIELLSERMEWLRRHIPAYSGEGENYVFISCSHRDFKP